MKYIVLSSLLFLFSCASQQNKPVTDNSPKDAIVAPTAVITAAPGPKEGPEVLLDGISAGTELTRKQMVLYFHADTTYDYLFDIRSTLASINLLGDSLLMTIVHQDEKNCSKAQLYIINRYSFQKISEKEIEVSCDMDDQAQDHTSFEFTSKQEFVLTTQTYADGAESDGPSATVKEYWTILPDGQLEKKAR